MKRATAAVLSARCRSRVVIAAVLVWRICCDGLRDQRDPGDETPWPDRLGKMEREVTGCADDCCHPSHGHALRVVVPYEVRGWSAAFARELLSRMPVMRWQAVGDPIAWPESDTHDEWRKLNDGE